MTVEIKNNPLHQFNRKIASQHGEDGVLEEVFKRIGVIDFQAWCVEFGAGDGSQYNTNTWHFIKNRGWGGVLIEADPVYFKDLPGNYRNNSKVYCYNVAVGFEGPNVLDAILQSTPLPTDFDFLCIDVDGNDYHIWESVRQYQPKVVMIEYNGRVPHDIEFVQPRDMRLQWGSSLLSLYHLGKAKGYELVYAHVCNAIFVRKEFFGRFDITDNFPLALVENESVQTRFFQLYDGTIVLIGCERNKLLCHKKKVSQEPVWVMDSAGLYPVRFSRDSRLGRGIKQILKNSFMYPLMYPLIRKIYDRLWDRRRNELLKSKHAQDGK